MVFINQTGSIGIVINSMTTTTTGSLFLSLLLILILIIAICLMFRIRLEYTAIIVFPLLLSYMAYYGEFIAIGTVAIFYLAIVLTKVFLFR